MKKRLTIILTLLFLCLPSLSCSAAIFELTDTSTFLNNFNTAAGISKSGHHFPKSDAEYIKADNGYHVKSVFNGCEILTVEVVDGDMIRSILCNWCYAVPGSSEYMYDYMLLLTETLYALKADENTISTIFTKVGESMSGNAKVGDVNSFEAGLFRVTTEVDRIVLIVKIESSI